MATKSPEPSSEASPHRRRVPPRSLAPASAAGALSPSFYRAPFRATDAPSSSIASSTDEYPCVALFEWWLVRVEGDDQRIAVSGFTERNQAVQIFTSTPIVKRHDACTLGSEDGIVVLIHGSLNISRMLENGFSTMICERFSIGFPHWWESWNSHVGSQTASSEPSNSQVNSTLFYLEKFQLGKILDSVGSAFIENLLNNAESFSDDNSDAFETFSYLSDKTPRFEEYTCENDISTTEKAAASDLDSKGSAVCKEMDSMEIDLIVSNTLKERHHVDLHAPLTLAVECTSDETYRKEGNHNNIMHPDSREQGSGSHLLNRCKDHVANDLEDGNANAESSVDLGSKYVVATTPPERANCSMEIAGDLENTPAISCCRTPVASLKNQGKNKETHKKEKKSIGQRKEQRSVHVLQGATRSPIIKNPISYAHQSPLNRAKAKMLSVSTPESLKLGRTKSGHVLVPTLDPGCQRIVYDRNGSISGVTGLELQPPPKGSKSETPVRKKRVH